VLISFVSGGMGIAFGFRMSRLIGWLAGWFTIVTLRRSLFCDEGRAGYLRSFFCGVIV